MLGVYIVDLVLDSLSLSTSMTSISLLLGFHYCVQPFGQRSGNKILPVWKY